MTCLSWLCCVRFGGLCCRVWASRFYLGREIGLFGLFGCANRCLRCPRGYRAAVAWPRDWACEVGSLKVFCPLRLERASSDLLLPSSPRCRFLLSLSFPLLLAVLCGCPVDAGLLLSCITPFVCGFYGLAYSVFKTVSAWFNLPCVRCLSICWSDPPPFRNFLQCAHTHTPLGLLYTHPSALLLAFRFRFH